MTSASGQHNVSRIHQSKMANTVFIQKRLAVAYANPLPTTKPCF
jgi:hypothetical protein